MEAAYTVTMYELDPATCCELLDRVRFGRVAFVDAEGVAVLSVNAAVRDGAVYFRTCADSALGRLTPGDRVAFQADHADAVSESGWSVLVRGVASAVTDRATLDALADSTVHPWAPGPRDRWMRIEPTTVTGRRIERHAITPPGERLPYMEPG
jgi:nitroimidazol reductase NimA-like FMN-containing flavoprotein (pyridoxamine 5'-phosphate oxidase superfamily)